MNSFLHFDAGNLAVLLAVLAMYRKVSIMSYQHGLMWRDFEKRKKLNGEAAAAGD